MKMLSFDPNDDVRNKPNTDSHLQNRIEGAMKGEAVELHQLGIDYQRGKYVSYDEDKARLLFELAASQNYSLSLFILGEIYRVGRNVSIDYDKSIGYFTKAAMQGYDTAERSLVEMCLEHKGAIENYNDFVELLLTKGNDESAYDDEDEFDELEKSFPQLYLGLLYFDGYCVSKNNEAAFNWFLKSSYNHNYFAWFNLGFMYSHGYGTELDYENALFRYSQAMLDAEFKYTENDILLLKDECNHQEIIKKLTELTVSKLYELFSKISTHKHVV
jgi:hypothetical protein